MAPRRLRARARPPECNRPRPRGKSPALRIRKTPPQFAAALQGLQAGGLEDRIAKAAERTAKGVEGLRQDVKNNRPAFA